MHSPYHSASIEISGLGLGGDNPVRLQSMTSTDTNLITDTVEQCLRMIEAGAELLRLTVQGKKELESLKEIKRILEEKGHTTPVVADIHFKPRLALEATGIADKIRINPGNYLRGGTVDELLPSFLEACRKNGTAIRIGVNHGSLDTDIMEEYGDTPEGMVESAMRFLRVCKKQNMDRVVVSMKSSNPRVMVYSVRLLADTMAGEDMNYPLHLGVTEAGDGWEGRIKSAAGMAPLLLEGLGDTIRVSLTEDPEKELPVAALLVDLFPRPGESTKPDLPYGNRYFYRRRRSVKILGIGGGSKTKIVSALPPVPGDDLEPVKLEGRLVSYEEWLDDPQKLSEEGSVLLLEKGEFSIQQTRERLRRFCSSGEKAPILYKWESHEKDEQRFRFLLAGELAFLLMDGTLDAVWIENPEFTAEYINESLLLSLQAAGSRISRTEFIACPSCGRTQFDLQSRLQEIKAVTGHLASLKIAVMGCIVNGPGEMADADYGYVGAGPGRVSLYRGRELVEKNLPEDMALNALIDLIRASGDWK